MANASALPIPRRPINVRWIGVVVVILIAIAALVNTGAITQIRQRIPGLADTAVTYETAAPAKGNLVLSVTATGPLSAVTSIPLSFSASGTLMAVNVAVGDKVKKGQVLAQIDPINLKIALDSAQSGLTTAKANLAKLQSGATESQKQVSQVAVDNAQTSATATAANLDTTKVTTSKGLDVSQAAVDSAQASLATTQSSLKAARDAQAVGLASDQVGLTNAQKNLATVRSTVAANLPVYQQQLEGAKNSLYAQQVSRDAACGHPGSTQCNTANASIAGAQTALDQANAQFAVNLKSGDTQISTAQTSVDTAQSQLTSDASKLGAAVVSAQNALNQAQVSYASAQKSLASAQAQADATIQSAQSQIATANGSVNSAKASLNQVLAPPVQADIDTVNAQIANAQSAVDTAQQNLAGATLIAPSDGTVATINGAPGIAIPGGAVAVGGTAFMTLVDLGTLQVSAQVNEADIARVAIGDAVTFDVSAFPGRTFDGKVMTIQPVGATVQNVVTYNVTSMITPVTGVQLLPGMTATVTIVTAEHDGVSTIPNAALSFSQAAIRTGLVQFNRSGQNGAGRTGTPGPRAAGQGGAAGTPSAGEATQTAGADQTPAAGATASGTPGPRGAGQGQGSQRGAGAANRNIVMLLKDGKLTPAPITVGLTDGTSTEIVSGLADGDQVVIGPIPKATTGTGTAAGARPATSPLGGGGPGGAIRFGGG